jgi:CBS domain containing-hemolysin-like protein
VPKSIALQSAEKTAFIIVRPMVIFARVFSPMIWLLNGLGHVILVRIGVKDAESHGGVHSPEELDLLVSQSHQGGELNDTEAEILHRVVRFADLTLREVMVPRMEISALPVEIRLAELRAWIHSRPHSRVPVYHGTLDEVIGVAHLKELVPFVLAQESQPDRRVSLMPLVREAPRLPETGRVDKALVEFKRRRQQMAVVIDEFGGTAGLVTMGDLLAQVFGDVGDEFDTPDEEIVVGPDGGVHLPGKMLIDDVNERFDMAFSVDEADTVAGLVLAKLGRPADVGDRVEIGGATLLVEAVDRLRITRILLRRGGSQDGPA